MKRHLNTLFVTTQGAYLRKDGEAVAVSIEKKTALRVPLNQLDGVVLFGRVSASPFLLGACAEAGVTVSMMTERGRFLAAVVGFTPGNVLLRREQYRRADDQQKALELARPMIAAKIANLRTVLLRGARDSKLAAAAQQLRATAERLAPEPDRTMRAVSLDQLRGIEGDAANLYFSAFNHLFTREHDAFRFTQRSRRPPMDPINALLSFLYTLLAHDVRSGCEAAGLDAAVGFLHRDRPGRPSLALDLMEALRPVLADRLALSLINRQQIKPDGFKATETGGVTMSDATRKAVLAAYQDRKKDELLHPFLNETVTIGLIPHLQARLLCRHLRGDHDLYPEFIWR
ncbi:MAG: type I-C CRISPR-associated endonuclease Cas1c [Phycisphaeraceae bacterium]